MKVVQKYQTPAGTLRKRVPTTYAEIVDAAEKAHSKREQKETAKKAAKLNLDYEIPNYMAENVQPKDGTTYRVNTPEQQEDNTTLGQLRGSTNPVPGNSSPYKSTAGQVAGALPFAVVGGLVGAGLGQALSGSYIGGLAASGIRTGLQGLTNVLTPSTWLNPFTGKALLSPVAGTTADAAIQGALSYQGVSGLWDQLQNGTLGTDVGHTVLNTLAALPLARPLAYAGKLAKAEAATKTQPFLGFNENGLSISYNPEFDAAFYNNAQHVENLLGVKPRFSEKQLFDFPYTGDMYELLSAARLENDAQFTNGLIDGLEYLLNMQAMNSSNIQQATNAAQSIFAKKLFGLPAGNSLAKGRLSEQEIQWALREFGEREASKRPNPEAFMQKVENYLRSVPVMRPTAQEATYAGFTAGGAYIPYTPKVPNMDPMGMIWIAKRSKGHHEIRHFLDYMIGMSAKDRELLRETLGKFKLDPDEWPTLLSDSRDKAYELLSTYKNKDVASLPLEERNALLSKMAKLDTGSRPSVEVAVHHGSPEGKQIWNEIENWPGLSYTKKDEMHKKLYNALRSLWTKMGIGTIGVAGANYLNNSQDNETY